MNVWEIAILKSIKSLGGEAGLKEIYERLPDFKQLTEKALRVIPMDVTLWAKKELKEYRHWEGKKDLIDAYIATFSREIQGYKEARIARKSTLHLFLMVFYKI